jgi:DNA-binding GntR family transcriptional regulator
MTELISEKIPVQTALSNVAPAVRAAEWMPMLLADDLSLSYQAYQQLEERIVTLHFEPGSSVSESQLSSLLGIGRTPIREALQRLSREHLVTILPKRGIFIAQLDLQKQLKVLETRREIERLVCRKAAKRATELERQQFARIADDFRKVVSQSNNALFLKVDKELNDLSIQAAKNEYAASAMLSLQGLSRRFWFGKLHPIASLSLIAQLHADVADAIAQGEEARAANALDQLLDYIEALTRKSILGDDA